MRNMNFMKLRIVFFDPLIAQIEGGVIISLGTALKEEVKFAKGGVKSANFDDYNVMRMSEVPEIEVHIVKSSEKIGGIGEVGVPAAAPARRRGGAMDRMQRGRLRNRRAGQQAAAEPDSDSPAGSDEEDDEVRQ